uniref:Uncharacterized protein n=1 Tax=Rhizophora mucronata TaxID=61149 RepID=A0A2P2JEX2_RHIMU
MALSHCLIAVPVDSSSIIHPPETKTCFLKSSTSSSTSLSPSVATITAAQSPVSLALFPSSLRVPKARELSVSPKLLRIGHKVKAQPQESEVSLPADAFTQFSHLLLPVTDRNPYLSEGTRQAVATTTALAKKYGADITVVGKPTPVCFHAVFPIKHQIYP